MWHSEPLMDVIKVKRHLDSETLYLRELRPLLGQDVQIIILASDVRGGQSGSASAREELRGSVLRYDDPCAPVGEDDWEALQ